MSLMLKMCFISNLSKGFFVICCHLFKALFKQGLILPGMVTAGGETTASWKFFPAMHSAMRNKHSIQPINLIASVRGFTSDSEESPSDPGHCSADPSTAERSARATGITVCSRLIRPCLIQTSVP